MTFVGHSLAVTASGYGAVAVLLLVVLGLCAVILVLAHAIGPRRHGPVKDSTYESGMEPIADTRRRFHVRFYLVAVMYLVFSVEVLFLYPWALVFTGLRSGLDAPGGGPLAATGEFPPAAAHALDAAGYGPGYLLGALLVFFVLLLVGFLYEWRKGIFQWD